MSILETIEKPKDGPIIMTVLGEPGVGKTTLAASFPKPVFLLADKGNPLRSIPEETRPAAFPKIQAVSELWAQLSALVKEEHEFKTVVIDSVTALESIFIQHVIDSDTKKPKGINQAAGGYGNGMNIVAGMHHSVRKAGERLADKGINVIFIAHADVHTIDPPDGEPYSKYSLRLDKKCLSPYVDDCDNVAFIKDEIYTRGDGNIKKAVGNGNKIIDCTSGPASISKNRYGIEELIPFVKGQNPFQQYLTN